MTTARADLQEVVEYWTTAGGNFPVDAERANQLIDAFAHELAEKSRVAAEKRYQLEGNWYSYAGAMDGADLIDPERN